MNIFELNATLPTRFRVLVNGFADDAEFPTLDEAVKSIPDGGVEYSSFEIYDTIEREYVWTRQRRKCGWPALFSIRVNGRPNGQAFVRLDEAIQAIQAISARRPSAACEVFEAGTRVFARRSAPVRELAQAG
ncbi:hypothetical protein CCR94_15250 [Rhodoblastus sphagnicola]|uniref:Uncharacterized protein n=1 Tax=Rhodoblastus sphagnicola TaxID=333368 RepID=A0A2S6N4B0_9HYPH|nr:hypothetical protein [Rhodoblastus sphagnicola]MBB4200342.1 hypothetical protein [Rhodoblastus sphagnicola]PPQ29461.1 hypothetical protein CCR94_15250 [Rhodoblastus sphagnicola]